MNSKSNHDCKVTVSDELKSLLKNRKLDVEFLVQTKIKMLKQEVTKILYDQPEKLTFIESINVVQDLVRLSEPSIIFGEVNQIVIDYSKIISSSLKSSISQLSSSSTHDLGISNICKIWSEMHSKFYLVRLMMGILESKEVRIYSAGYETDNRYNLWHSFITIINSLLSIDDKKIVSSVIVEFVSNTRTEFVNLIENSNLTHTNQEHVEELKKIILQVTSRIVALEDFISFGIETLIYQEEIEAELVRQTYKFYEDVSIRFTQVKNDTCISRLIYNTENIKHFEEILFTNHFDKATLSSINDIVDNLLIRKNTDKILDSLFEVKPVSKAEALNSVCKENPFTLTGSSYSQTHPKTVDCSLTMIKMIYAKPSDEYYISYSNQCPQYWNHVYNALKRVRALDSFKVALSDYIKNISELIGRSSNFYLVYMSTLKDTLEYLINYSFEADENIKLVMKETLYKVVNSRPNQSAEYFCDFLNVLFTSQLRFEIDYSQIYEKFIVMFKLLEAKDQFAQIYSEKMSFRLLYEITNNFEEEKRIIETLKSTCGIGFVSKLEDIISDIESGKSLTNSFNQAPLIYKGKESKIKFTFSAMSELVFKSQSISNHPVLPEIDYFLHQFVMHYKKKFAGRSLKWKLNSSLAHINFKVKGRKFNLHANGIQAVILLKFNSSPKFTLTAGDLKHVLKDMEMSELTSCLDHLASVGIIIRSGGSYAVNNSYSSPKTGDCSIVLHQFLDVQSKIIENEIDEEKSIEDRKPVIDCLIMKSLKFNKQMSQDELINSVKTTSKFKCDDKLIESRIEHLLSNEFIHKDSEGILKYF